MSIERINIPITVPESQVSLQNEQYNLTYENLRADISIDNWTYCTVFDAPIDHKRLVEAINRGGGDNGDGRHHTLSSNALVEHKNHDMSEINFHYRHLLADIGAFIKREEEGRVVGVRQCANLFIVGTLNRCINLNHLVRRFPGYTKELPTSQTICLDIGSLIRKEGVNPRDALNSFMFSVDEYQKLCDNEMIHLSYNEMIDASLIRIVEDMNDLSSTTHAKINFLPSGHMLLYGIANRRSAISVMYNVLRVVSPSCYDAM